MTMPSPIGPRTGSFLLFAFAMIAVLVALAFALLQTTRLSTDSGLSAQRIWLAQEAAKAGLDHAMENIVRDYSIPGRPTTLDDSWHRDFKSLGRDMNQPNAEDDVRIENTITDQLYYPADFAGTARYYEVNYYDPADRTAVRFTGTSTPPPSRNDRLLLNVQLKRVATGDPARYRLRYAVVANDLDGYILINPALDRDYRDAWRPGTPAISYAALPASDPYKALGDLSAAYAGATFAPDGPASDLGLGRRLERYSYSLYNILYTGNTDATVNRTTHVFRLRGYAGNVAQDANGWPVTFPTMFRTWSNAATSVRTNFADPMHMGVGLYRNLPAGTAQLEGGSPVTTNDGSSWDSVGHILTGPQFSFRNMDRSVSGYENNPFMGGGFISGMSDKLTPFGRAGEQGTRTRPVDWNKGGSDVPWVVNLMTAPPFVLDGMIYGYLPPGIKDDIVAERYYCYLSTGEYTDCVAERTLPTPITGDAGKDLFTSFMSPAFATWPVPAGQPLLSTGAANAQNPAIWPNYFIPDTRTASQVYPGPYASLAKSVHATLLAVEDTGKHIDADAEHGNGADPYTNAALCSLGSPPVTKRGGNVADDYRARYTLWGLSASDDKLPATPVIDATGIETPMPTGAAPTTRAGTPGTWGYHPEDKIVKVTTAKSDNSFFFDISRAFTSAITVFRAHWIQGATGYVDPAVAFPSGRLTIAEVDSVEDLDRLFLRQLGIDMSDPSSASIARSWKVVTSTNSRFTQGGVTLKNNIRSLVVHADDPLRSGTVTGVMRARVMEMMLNDWRMSFLGSSPDYPNFRPLDFDGDGQAICNCYASRGAYGDDVAGVTWARSAAPAGVGGPPDIHFSLTGCLTIAKSHYYRVFTRGELWDDLLKRTVAMTTLETVLSIDADGDVTRVPAAPETATGISNDISVLHQRWYWNRYNALMPTVTP